MAIGHRRLSLALSLLGLSLENSALGQSRASTDGVDVSGNVYCFRGREEVPAGDVLVVYVRDRSKNTSSSPDDGAYRLSFPRVSDVANQNLTLRFLAGTNVEEHTWPLRREPSRVAGTPTYILDGLTLRVRCEKIDGRVAKLAEEHFELRTATDRVVVTGEMATTVDPFNAWSFAPQIGWSRDWFSPASSLLLDTAIGTRLTLGGIVGQYQTPGPFTPGRSDNEVAKNGKGLLTFLGGLAELDVEVRFARAAPISYAIGLGMRAGLAHRDKMETDADQPFWGPILSAAVLWPWSGRLTGVVRLHLSEQMTPYAKNPANCRGPSTPFPSQFDTWGGVAIGAEIQP
jgi:hypothetical protein